MATDTTTLPEAANSDTGRPSTIDIVATPMPWREAPVARQVGVIVALAAAVAIGVAVALWSQEPEYTPLFAELAEADAIQIGEVLKNSQTEYKIDMASGQIMVPADKVRQIRLQLASQGLPANNAVMGLEILNEKQDLTTSQFIETARYKHALENELARSISQIRAVKAARVHLAMPKETIFVRERQRPTASVVVELMPGRVMADDQVQAVVHMVSSSIPSMTPNDVTVVDQTGRLLTDGAANEAIGMSGKQFEYTRKIESNYADRIVQILEPVVGLGKVRAQVTAKMDFTQEETAREAFDPQGRVVRSEQLAESESDRSMPVPAGVPGALTNQPPGEGTTDPNSAAAQADETQTTGSSTRNATRNYEVDRTVSYRRGGQAGIDRLSIAVVIDDKVVMITPEPTAAEAPAEGEATAAEGDAEPVAAPEPVATRQSYDDAELAKFERLIKEAIGFDEMRGDSISLINQSFLEEKIEPLPEIPIWEREWFVPLIKQTLGGIFVLVLLIWVIRPTVKALLSPPARIMQINSTVDADGMVGEGDLADSEPEDVSPRELEFDEAGRLVDPEEEARQRALNNQLSYARSLIEDDPARAANLLKVWLQGGNPAAGASL
ncbi:MAG: flagellar M-ring protein FliF [Gammaproteobacteria bacterium]|nr:flagellar M-ring protein FliF [Gammaproteobacteria bacterium]